MQKVAVNSRDHPLVTTWITLAVAALGIAGTIGGAWLTQRHADRREERNREWSLERERNRWAREDAAKTYEFRRNAYVDFYQAAIDHGLQTVWYVVDVHIDGQQDREPPGGGAVQETFDAIQIYGSPRVLEPAKAVQKACYRFRAEVQRPDFGMEVKELQDESDAALRHLLDAIREELGVPNDGVSKPVS